MAELTGGSLTEAVTLALRERLAKSMNVPLLSKGQDFGRTDIAGAS